MKPGESLGKTPARTPKKVEMSVRVKDPSSGDISVDPDIMDLDEESGKIGEDDDENLESNRVSAQWDSVHHRGSLEKLQQGKRQTILRKMSNAVQEVHLEKKLKPPMNLGVLICIFPLFLIIYSIRLRHMQLNDNKDHDDDSSDSAYSAYSTTYSTYSSTYSSYSESDPCAGGHRRLAGGGDGCDDHSLDTVFQLGSTIDPQSMSFVLALIILVTMILDFGIEQLNEFTEYCGQVYEELARLLYQELMLLGIISFTIFLMKTEGFFEGDKKLAIGGWVLRSDKAVLFHEVEYGHLVLFYLGIGLLVQGSVLGIINREIKVFWKYSVGCTVDDIQKDLDEEKKAFLGEWKVKHGFTSVRRTLDIHLVRITFCELMNLPPNFAYSEYVNNALDRTTIKIASCTSMSWATLVVFIISVAHLDSGGLFFGTKEDNFWWFGAFGSFLMIMNVLMLVAITLAKNNVLHKIGGHTDANLCLISLKEKTNAEEQVAFNLERLKEREREMTREKKQHKKIGFKHAAKSFKTMAKVTNVLKRRSTKKELLEEKGLNPEDFAKFQYWFTKVLRVTNLLQAFYISMIITHWAWYATSHSKALIMIVPLLVIYIFLTPRIVRRYAMVMSLGKPQPKALSHTIEYMEHNEMALHEVAMKLVIKMEEENVSLENIFQDWDTNGDKELSYEELEHAMFEANLHLPEARFKAMWKKIDVDSSGSLDETEFVRAVTPYVDQVRREREASIDRSGSVERGLSKPM